MKPYPYALSAVALVVCQLAAAQPYAPSAGVAPDGSNAGRAQQLGDGSGTAVRTFEDGGASSQPATSEPRILRGNDRVIAAPKNTLRVDGPPISFNFEEAPIAEVVRTILGDVIKADYVLHPPLNGTVTLSTKVPVAPDQAVFLLESALQANGLALLRDARGSYHVGRPDALKSIGSAVRQAGSGTTLPPGYGAIVVPLQYIGANEMAAILRPLMPADSMLRVDSVRNLLVLAGTRNQAEGWLDLVATFDVDLLKGMSVGVFPLKYATIKEVESALRLVSGGAGASGASTPAGNTAVTAQSASAGGAQGGLAGIGDSNPLFGALRIMPIERINSVLVVTPRAAYLEEARRWIERLDQPSDNGADAQLFVYQVKNVNARHLTSVLSGIFGDGKQQTNNVSGSGVAPGLSTSTGNAFGQQGGGANLFGGNSGSLTGGFGSRTGGFSQNTTGTNMLGGRTGQGTGGATATAPTAATLGSIRVMADELNNAVLVWSTRAEYAKIEATLKRLDLPLTQVLIEASIVEVTLSDDLQYGLQWEFSDNRANTGYTGVGRLSNTNTTTPGSLVQPSSGFSYTLRNPAGNVRAVLSALSAKTSVKVLASPSLMVLDNHTASIAVGDQTPVQAGTTSNLGVVTSNIQYKDTGINLIVTPSVNSGNIVTMQVEQSVTDVGGEDEITKQRAFLQRQLSSKLAVRSGESIVMGGLIQERGATSKSGVPLLHTLPVIGNLFGTTANEGKRTELIVVITPRVVRSDIDIKEVSEDLRDRMKGLAQIKEFDAHRKTAPVQPAQAIPFSN